MRFFILYRPGVLFKIYFAALIAPLAKIFLDVAWCEIVIISSFPANITSWSPVIVPPRIE